MGYRSESLVTHSDYSETKKACLLRHEHARKNGGLGHDDMDTAEEEVDDEKIMEEEDEQERHQMKNKKGLKKPSDTNQGKSEDFAQKLCWLVKSKPPVQRPSADSGVSDANAEGASEIPTARPVASTKALGKK
jgi:hypothetical protein